MEYRGLFNRRPRQTKCIASKLQRHWWCRAGIFREIELCGVRAEQDRDGVINQLHRRVRDEHDACLPSNTWPITDLADIDGNRSISLMPFRILVECACQCSGGCRSEQRTHKMRLRRWMWLARREKGGLRQAPLRSTPNKHPP